MSTMFRRALCRAALIAVATWGCDQGAGAGPPPDGAPQGHVDASGWGAGDRAPDGQPDEDGGAPADWADVPSDQGPKPPDAGVCDLAAPQSDVVVERRGRWIEVPRFESAHVGARPITIYLPAEYEVEPDRSFPVMYMHDGQNLFDSSRAFGGEWRVDETVDALVGAGWIEPLVIVGVHNTPDRLDDYTPSIDPTHGGGRLAAYGRFLVEELKPWIDATLRTRCDRRATGLAGSSLGGLASLWLLDRYPTVFGRIGVVSPSLWWNDGEALGWAPDLRDGWMPGSRLWIDGGGAEGEDLDGDGRSSVVEATRALYEALLAQGVPGGEIAYLAVPLAAHDEAAWAARLPAILAFLWGPEGPPDQPEALAVRSWRVPLERGAVGVIDVDVLGPGPALRTLAFGQAALETDDHGVAAVVGGDRLVGVAEGQTVLRAEYLGLQAALPIAVGVPVEVVILVSVPQSTPPGPLFLTGDLPVLGAWAPDGLALQPIDEGRWWVELRLAAGQRFEFKVTRGTWETVEKGPGEEELPNRVGVAGGAPIEVRVARWADTP